MPAFICPQCASPLTASPERAPTCRACGGEIGISAKELVARLVAARAKELK